MKTILKTVAVAAVAAMTMTTAITAEARAPGGASGFHGGSVSHGSWGGRGWNGGGWGHRGYWGGGYWGPYWGGLALGLGVGAIAYSAYGAYGYDGYYAYPAYGVAPTGDYLVDTPAPPPAQAPAAPMSRSTGQPVPLASRAPDPIFYPKNGQSTAKTDSDRQECNRWATTQAGAMNDSSIFQRATFACMEGRGYVIR